MSARIAFLFPGQGTQKIGMAKDIYDKYPLFSSLFADIKRWIGVDIEKLVFQQNDDIDKTQYTQIAILAVELGILRVIKDFGIKPCVLAGYSLGEYAALVAAGALSEEDAMKLIKERGMLMSSTVANGVGGMAAVIGASVESIQKVLDRYDSLEIVNYNTPSQVSIAGLKSQVEACADELKEAGARRVVMLNVSGPFHSKLLSPAGDKFYKILEDFNINDLQIPYYPNYTGKLKKDSKDIKDILSKQICSPVLWNQSMDDMMANCKLDAIVEVGYSNVLRGFLRGKENCPQSQYGTSSVEDIEKLVQGLK